MRALLGRLFASQIRDLHVQLTTARRTNAVLTAELELAVHDRDQAVVERDKANGLLDRTSTQDGAYWRRECEQQRRTNALLDDRLAAAEGRPTFASGRSSTRAREQRCD